MVGVTTRAKIRNINKRIRYRQKHFDIVCDSLYLYKVKIFSVLSKNTQSIE